MTETHKKHIPWLLWPFWAIGKLVLGILAATGRLVAVILGLVFLIVGVVLTATVVGAIVRGSVHYLRIIAARAGTILRLPSLPLSGKEIHPLIHFLRGKRSGLLARLSPAAALWPVLGLVSGQTLLRPAHLPGQHAPPAGQRPSELTTVQFLAAFPAGSAGSQWLRPHSIPDGRSALSGCRPCVWKPVPAAHRRRKPPTGPAAAGKIPASGR